MPDHPPTYLAGLVAFCRGVDDTCYELGIEIKAAGSHPILTQDISESCVVYDWFAEALGVPE